MLKRVACLLLCMLFVASSLLLVACDDGEATSSTTSVTGDASGFLNEAKNWGGKDITILGYNGEFIYHTSQIAPEELCDEPVSDAVYNRNTFIAEQYGLNIEVVVPTQEQDPIAMIKNDVSANTGEFNVLINPLNWMTSLVTENMIYDYNSIQNGYLHLDKEWWDQDIIEDLVVNDKVFFLAGDAIIEDDESTWAMFFNKDMFTSNAALAEYGSIYKIVEDGKWTLDVMYEMLKNVNRTVGDTKDYKGALEADGDQWGMVAQMYDFYLFMQGCEQILIDNDGEVPTMRIDDDLNISTFNALANIMYDDQNVGVAESFGSWNSGVYQEKRQIFAAGNALFMPSQLATVGQQVMRNANIRYGILPMPKRNELQDRYTTSVQVYHCAAIAIPVSVVGEDLDATCYALEAMAYYGKQKVTPEYYDRTLTYKRFEDEESGAMLEILFNNKIYDMGAVFEFGTGEATTLQFYTSLFGQKNTNIVSHFETRRNVFQAGIDDFIAKCYNA